MNHYTSNIIKALLTIITVIIIGSIFIVAKGEDPLFAYTALFKGAFGTRLGLGNTIASFTPLLLTSIAFAIAAKAGAFNVGVEGEMYLGGITAAYIGIHWTFLPAPVLLIACFLGAMIIAGLWALIPAYLRAYYNVSEVCVTILMNTVAVYICSYLVSGPLSANTAIPQSQPVSVTLPKIMPPSTANVGIIIAISIVLFVMFMLYRTTWGYKIRVVGDNPDFADYVGINAKHTFINTMIVSGVLGGIAGCIEVLGVHGYYLDNFAKDLGTNGMLSALIVKSNVLLTPIVAFLLSVLRSGAMAMQQTTGVPKSIIDIISAVFIILATMQLLFKYGIKRHPLGKPVCKMQQKEVK